MCQSHILKKGKKLLHFLAIAAVFKAFYLIPNTVFSAEKQSELTATSKSKSPVKPDPNRRKASEIFLESQSERTIQDIIDHHPNIEKINLGVGVFQGPIVVHRKIEIKGSEGGSTLTNALGPGLVLKKLEDNHFFEGNQYKVGYLNRAHRRNNIYYVDVPRNLAFPADISKQ